MAHALGRKRRRHAYTTTRAVAGWGAVGVGETSAMRCIGSEQMMVQLENLERRFAPEK